MPTTISSPAVNILARGNITTQNLVAAGLATAGSAVEINCEGVSVVRVQVTGTYTGVLTPQATIDGVTWVTLSAVNALVSATGAATPTIASGTTGIFIMQVSGCVRVRITGLAAMTGTAVVTLIGSVASTPHPSQLVAGVQGLGSAAPGNPVIVGGVVRTTAAAALTTGVSAYMPLTSGAQVIQKPYGPAETDWVYAAATGGITNTTTAVTIKAAGAASIRNYVTGIDIMAQALGAATEVAIRDGAGGAVLWRTYIGTGGQVLTHVAFPTPLKGTAATLLEVVTLTASVTGAVFFNAQGYQGG